MIPNTRQKKVLKWKPSAHEKSPLTPSTEFVHVAVPGVALPSEVDTHTTLHSGALNASPGNF